MNKATALGQACEHKTRTQEPESLVEERMPFEKDGTFSRWQSKIPASRLERRHLRCRNVTSTFEDNTTSKTEILRRVVSLSKQVIVKAREDIRREGTRVHIITKALSRYNARSSNLVRLGIGNLVETVQSPIRERSPRSKKTRGSRNSSAVILESRTPSNDIVRVSIMFEIIRTNKVSDGKKILHRDILETDVCILLQENVLERLTEEVRVKTLGIGDKRNKSSNTNENAVSVSLKMVIVTFNSSDSVTGLLSKCSTFSSSLRNNIS